MRRIPLAIAAAFLLSAAPASAAGPIQPGIEANTEAGQCTFNFIFDGVGANAGRTFIGLAAHCVEKIGEEVSDADGDLVGRAAFIGDADDTTHDYAFIEIPAENLARVDPAMKGHPEYPTGYTTPEETSAGDLIQMSGYGLGFGLTQPTQEERVTVLQGDDEEMFWLSGPSVNGDSGGPFVHIDTGKALGIVSMYGFETGSTDMGPTVQGILAKAAAANFPVALRAAGQPAPVAKVESQPEPAQQQPATTTATTTRSAEQPKPAAAKKPKKAKKCKRKHRGKSGKAVKKAKKCKRKRGRRH